MHIKHNYHIILIINVSGEHQRHVLHHHPSPTHTLNYKWTSPMPKLEDLSDSISKEQIKTLKKGDLLRFNYEGSISEFIITKLNKKSHIVLARETKTHKPEDVTIEDAYGTIETFNEMMEDKNG